jgi:hypothetical protein
MKKLRELLRINPVPTIHFGSEVVPERKYLRRVEALTDSDPDTVPEVLTGTDTDKPRDVARELWCSAGHF